MSTIVMPAHETFALNEQLYGEIQAMEANEFPYYPQKAARTAYQLAASPAGALGACEFQSHNLRLCCAGYDVAKRVMDVCLGTLLLILALPAMLVCALLIWIEDPGSVLFAQPRTGKAGRRFRMYKFRSMVRNAEELKQKYAHLNELSWPDFKITNDPRVTRIGKFLRRTSLDELPQLLNVLKGDMSLVGPRPTSFKAETYSLWHTERLEVVPGITGLWQISGRADVDFDQRLQLDIEYIERRSIWFDLQILVGTVSAVFSRRGAH